MNKEVETINSNKKPKKLLEMSFLLGVAGASILGGFGMALAMAKKKDPVFFFKGMVQTKEMPESGSALALKALSVGTLYAVTGFTMLCCGVWKLMGVNDLHEFRQKIGNILPEIPKSENPGRSDFKNLRDLLEYVIEESDKKKKT